MLQNKLACLEVSKLTAVMSAFLNIEKESDFSKVTKLISCLIHSPNLIAVGNAMTVAYMA